MREVGRVGDAEVKRNRARATTWKLCSATVGSQTAEIAIWSARRFALQNNAELRD